MTEQTLLAVFAHPDDETYRPGGTLALLAGQGVRIELLTFTRGEAGSCGNPPLCSPAELSEVRERELNSACALLGIQPPRLLDYIDGRLQDNDAEKMISKILEVVQEIMPQVILSFGPDGLSGHPDHIAVSEWAADAYRRSKEVAALYSITVPQSLVNKFGMRQLQPVPDEMITLSVDISPIWDTKLAAMRCHATQISSSPIMSAPPEQQILFFGSEYFVCSAIRRSEADFMPKILKRPLSGQIPLLQRNSHNSL